MQVSGVEVVSMEGADVSENVLEFKSSSLSSFLSKRHIQMEALRPSQILPNTKRNCLGDFLESSNTFRNTQRCDLMQCVNLPNGSHQ